MLSLAPGSKGGVQSSQSRGSREPPTPGTPSPAWPCLPMGADKAPFAALPMPSPGSAWSSWDPSELTGWPWAPRVARAASGWGEKMLPLLCPPGSGAGAPRHGEGVAEGSGVGSRWEQGQAMLEGGLLGWEMPGGPRRQRPGRSQGGEEKGARRALGAGRGCCTSRGTKPGSAPLRRSLQPM